MSEELQSLVQNIELYGRGLEGLGKAIRFSAKGAEKGVQIAQVKALQHRMKLHYASEGTHNTMKLSDLEKMIGGRYTILNIPLEDEKELIAFYDRLKKLKVSFSELPDLNLGDGYTQIAYNPDDVESVRLVIDYYKKKFRQEAKEMDLDEYFGTASPGGLEYLDELAAKGYEGRMHEGQLEEIQERIRDKEYIPISINVESLLLREEKDACLFRIPRGSDSIQDIVTKLASIAEQNESSTQATMDSALGMSDTMNSLENASESLKDMAHALDESLVRFKM